MTNLVTAKGVGVKTLNQLQILLMLHDARADGLRLCDVAKELKVSSAALTQMTDHLVNAKLIFKKPDEKDRRVNRITLTPTGDQFATVFIQ